MPPRPEDRSRRAAAVFGRTLRSFVGDRSGGTAIEYGLICSLIFLAFVAAAKNYGTNLAIMYNSISGNVR